MFFMAVIIASTKKLAPYVRIVKEFEICGAIHHNSMYRLLESVLGVK